ncbi:MAG TPA: VPLPA-CTERM-specific exosortase XrtD, partial [Candidatus Acetothermia bacterium]|nr:VPLPA-CTERM-specific exosortase XrtD [Candidatus Acetothermia bacterium]
MTESNTTPQVFWRLQPWSWAVLGLLVPVLGYVYYDVLRRMVLMWAQQEAYSYGAFIPFISVFLVWQKRARLQRIPSTIAWGGVAVTAVGVAVYFLAQFSAISFIAQYSLVIILAGIAWALLGWAGFREIWIAFLFLVFMIPLPSVVFTNLSTTLELLSSKLGVDIIRFLGIAVNLEGNVIDLGTYKLQVAEACSGLRYLFPLMSLSFIAAYFYKASFWKRAVVFLSAIPITVVLNSIRIGFIGVLVEYWGSSMAQGFLHYFEGWAVFMVCIGIIIGEMWVLAQFGGRKRLRYVFGVDLPPPLPPNATIKYRAPTVSFWTALVLVAVVLVSTVFVQRRTAIVPPRTAFVNFPMVLGPWRGQPDRLESIFLQVLKLDDYLLANYTGPHHERINLYIAYYDSQRAGHSIHSPRACLPGGGWLIKRMADYTVPGIVLNGRPLVVKRVVIQAGNVTQLVYYWFQQRGRDLTGVYS